MMLIFVVPLSFLFPCTVLAAPSPPVQYADLEKRLNNGVGKTPAMGWNNYNAGLGATASSALAAANAFVSLGLDKLGYQFVNIDDGWSSMSRDATGNLVADPNKWPTGVKAVSDQIHGLGLKFGLYGDAGTATCAGFPGSLGHESQDAKQLASWGVDYWKYDNCNAPSGNSQPRYQTMSSALATSGRIILYSLCNWGVDSVWTWGASVGNSWRVGGDISNNWNSVAQIAANNAGIASYVQSGGFNDFDMMEVGNGGLTPAEERAHFGLWAISKSPLILGCDLTKISASSLAIINNKAVIAINQDMLGKAATYFQPAGSAAPTNGQLYPYWAGPLSDGVVIGLVAANGAATLNVNFADVPGLGPGSYSWTELYGRTSGTGIGVSATLASHDMAIFKVVTSKGGASSTAAPTTKATPTSTAVKTTPTPSNPVPTTTKQPVTSTTPSTPTNTGTVPRYGQCGGVGYAGSTVCAAGSTCSKQNDYYSQCL